MIGLQVVMSMLEGTRDNQSNVSKVFSQLNEVALLKSSNSAPVPDTKPMEPAKQSAAQNTNPDASSISAFMTQVADLVELVDSRYYNNCFEAKEIVSTVHFKLIIWRPLKCF
ncbi:hypothetical protein CsSME_00053244 [Camellia sinensis var. sinensis]